MREKIYCCSTYYHVLIACVKVLVEQQDADILLTKYIPQHELLYRRVIDAGVFKRVFLTQDVNEYVPKNLVDKAFNQHKKNTKAVESQIECDIKNYTNVYLFHDDTWMARYCKDANVKHTLIEDALDSYKGIDKTCFNYLIPERTIKTMLKRWFHLGYVYGENDKYTIQIEINDDKDIKIPLSKKIVVLPRIDLFNRLTADDEKIISKIFLAGDMAKIIGERKALLLTQPLYVDGIVQTEKEQIEVYHKIINEYLDAGYTLVVKPHPRDLTKYNTISPNCIVMDKDMPIEVLNYCDGIEFDIAVTLSSTSINGLNCVKNKIIIEK